MGIEHFEIPAVSEETKLSAEQLRLEQGDVNILYLAAAGCDEGMADMRFSMQHVIFRALSQYQGSQTMEFDDDGTWERIGRGEVFQVVASYRNLVRDPYVPEIPEMEKIWIVHPSLAHNEKTGSVAMGMVMERYAIDFESGDPKGNAEERRSVKVQMQADRVTMDRLSAWQRDVREERQRRQENFRLLQTWLADESHLNTTFSYTYACEHPFLEELVGMLESDEQFVIQSQEDESEWHALIFTIRGGNRELKQIRARNKKAVIPD